MNEIRDMFLLLRGPFELKKLYFLKITTWNEDVTVFMQHLNYCCKNYSYIAVCVNKPAQEHRRELFEMNKLYF